MSPPLVPGSFDQDIYLVFNDFGRLGRAWPETDEEHTDRDVVMQHLFEGQYSDPIRVVSFNTAEGWSRDVSEDFADELRNRCMWERGEIPPYLEGFIHRHVDGAVQLSLL